MKTIVSGFLLLIVSLPAQTGKYTQIEGLAPTPSYTVNQVRDKIVVDGRLSEKSWANAAPITLIFPWKDQTGIKQRTTVRLLRDQNYLYAGYDCEDVDITATRENRDDPVYLDDCVEIFIKPGQRSDHYFGLEMNARGALLDYHYLYPEKNDKTFNLDGTLIKTAINGTLNQGADRDRSWSLEVAIPWSNLKALADRLPPGSEDQWRAQLNRWDGTEAKGRCLSMWSHSGLKKPSPHNPERFGQLLFK